MKYALYDVTRDGYLEGGDYRTILWGGRHTDIENSKLYDTEAAARSSAKRLYTQYSEYTTNHTYQTPKWGYPKLALVAITYEVDHSELL